MPPRSVWIFRYYDQVSEEMNPDSHRPEMETYAEQLADFLDSIRDLVCASTDGDDDDDDDEASACRRVWKPVTVGLAMYHHLADRL